MIGRKRARYPKETAHSLVEVVVALVILAIGLLGSAGLVVSAAGHVARAVRLEVALSLAEGVADSLLNSVWEAPGERVEGDFLVSWSEAEGWRVVEVRSLEGTPLLSVPVPMVDR